MSGGTKPALYVRPVRGGGEPRLLIRDPEASLEPDDWSRDGLVILVRQAGAGADLWIYSVDDDELRPYVATPFGEWGGSIAPDGRYAAYVSDETGRPEIYVQTFPDAGERWKVSTVGGQMPMWRPDGKELFYLTFDGRMTAVPVLGLGQEGAAGAALELGVPEVLFRVDIKEHSGRQYDTLDGQRFLVNRDVHAGATDPLTLVMNWSQGLE